MVVSAARTVLPVNRTIPQALSAAAASMRTVT